MHASGTEHPGRWTSKRDFVATKRFISSVLFLLRRTRKDCAGSVTTIRKLKNALRSSRTIFNGRQQPLRPCTDHAGRSNYFSNGSNKICASSHSTAPQKTQ